MKSYGQICGIAQALDMIGDRWTLLIVRELLLGPLQYSELLSNLEGITSNLLADRLKHLDELGLVERGGKQRLAPYQLTAEGRTLEPLLFALGKWGWKHIDFSSRQHRRSLRWALVSVKRRLRPQGHDYTLVLSPTEGGHYSIWERKGATQVAAQESLQADASVSGPELALLKALIEAKMEPWLDPQLKWEGDRSVWGRMQAALSEAPDV